MSLQSKASRPFEEDDRPTKAKKGSGKKSSEAGAIRAFSAAAAYKGRLAKPGYVKACHSKLPEAVIKVIRPKDGCPVRGKDVLGVLRYIARADADQRKPQEMNEAGHMAALIVEDEAGTRHEGPEQIKKLYEDWAQRFDAEANNGKDPRHIMHLTMSAKAKNTPLNQKIVMDAARETAAALFPGHQYALGLHQDSNSPHVHLVIACNPKDKSQKKLRVGPSDLMKMRTTFARELTERGLTHVATLRKDRPHIQEKIRNGEERLKPERRYWFVEKDEVLLKSYKEIESLKIEFEKLSMNKTGSVRLNNIRTQIATKAEEMEKRARETIKQGGKTRSALFGATRKIKRAVGIETNSQERQPKKSSRPTLTEQKAALEAKIIERRAKGLPTDKEEGKLARIATIQAASASRGPGKLKAWELAQIKKAIEDGEKALKTADMTPEARALAEKVLNYHKATVAKATSPTPALAPETRTQTPQGASRAQQTPDPTVNHSIAKREAPKPSQSPQPTPAPSRGIRR